MHTRAARTMDRPAYVRQGEALSPRVEQRIEESVKLIAREFAPRVAAAVRSQKKDVPAATAYLSGQLSREYPIESTLNEAKRGLHNRPRTELTESR